MLPIRSSSSRSAPCSDAAPTALMTKKLPGHAAPPDRVGRVLHGDVVVDDERAHSDPVGLRHLLAHLEGHPVARVVVDDVQHAPWRREQLARLEHVVHRRCREDVARACRVEHPVAHDHDVRAEGGPFLRCHVAAMNLVVAVEPHRSAPRRHEAGHALGEWEDPAGLAGHADIGFLAVGTGRLVDAAVEPALQPSSSVQRSRIRSSSGRSENSPARSSATAINPAASAAASGCLCCGPGGVGRRTRALRICDSAVTRRAFRSAVSLRASPA